ncbi:MAG TPA: class I SAM-dependent methyltransferase [Rectinemataceae bacterium]|nr:class I SAM-dependent methyltransferase [Rectinemataceae bacterium]
MKTFATDPRPEKRTLRPCPICGSTHFSSLWDLGAFSFSRCSICGLVQQNPQPDVEFVLARYDESYLDYEVARHEDYAKLERMALADLGFAEIQQRLMSRDAPGGRTPSFLDVGCATGALIAGLSNEGWSCVGVEPCEPAARYGREVFGLDIRPVVLGKAALHPASFDIVHASHLIEHLNEPVEFLAEAKRLLAPGGVLILTTPNIDGFQARALGAKWRSAIYDHLFLFSFRNLGKMVENAGFEVLRSSTWGGWASGQRPRFVKKPLDKAVKIFGWGDVMALLCRPV